MAPLPVLHRTVRVAALSLAAALLLPSASLAQESGVCEVGGAPVPSGPVQLLLLSSDRAVHKFAKSVKNSEVLVRDSGTVIFADGRVVSSNPTAVESHLRDLGWTKRPLKLVASFRIRQATRPRRG